MGRGSAGVVLACVLGGYALVVSVRVWRLVRSGVNPLPVDRERTSAEMAQDLAFAIAFLGMISSAVAWLGEWKWPSVPVLSGGVSTALRACGTLLACASLVLYAKALVDMGDSWRFTIDRTSPPPLVTSGVFARSRNPIYLSLAMLSVGVAMVTQSLVSLISAVVVVAYLPSLVRREERFLAQVHGSEYERYRSAVRRWWTI